MGKKGRRRNRPSNARQVPTPAQQVETWRPLWRPEQAVGDRGGRNRLQRPHGICAHCEMAFMKHDSFHYSEAGPVHGWGKFEQTDTCRFPRKGGNGKPPRNQCLECAQTILKSDVSHPVNGGKIHGPGVPGERGTCVYRHRRDITVLASDSAKGFLLGRIDDAGLERVIEQVRTRERSMADRLASSESTKFSCSR